MSIYHKSIFQLGKEWGVNPDRIRRVRDDLGLCLEQGAAMIGPEQAGRIAAALLVGLEQERRAEVEAGDELTLKGINETLTTAEMVYGTEAQMLVAAGEIGELLTEVGRFAQGRDTRERWTDEIADVRIVTQWLLEKFSSRQEVGERIAFKVRRLDERIHSPGRATEAEQRRAKESEALQAGSQGFWPEGCGEV